MEVTQIVKQIASLSNSAQESSLAGEIVGDRSINPLLVILQKLIDELNKPQSDQRRLSRLSTEAREHWSNIAQAILRDNEAGQNVHKLDLKLVTDSKSLVDELAQKADERIRNRGNRRTDTPRPSVDSTQAAGQDASMTDLTRQEVDAKLAQNKAEVDARLANFDTSIKTGFAELRTEMAKQSGEMRTEMANVRADMHRNTIDLIKWGIVTAIALTSATVGILTFVINNVVPKAPAQAAIQPTPIVITVPGANVVPVPAQQTAK